MSLISVGSVTGSQPHGSQNSMSETVQLRLDKDLRAALQERAEHDHTTPSDIAREALRRYLAS
jgi:hypothetical protein